MSERFENFIDIDEERLSDIELRVLDLERGISEWRESRARELAESARHRAQDREFLRATGNPPDERSPGRAAGGRATAGRATGGRATGGRATGGRTSGERATGGRGTGGRATAGRATGGRGTGGRATVGRGTGGRATVGRGTGGRGTGGRGRSGPVAWTVPEEERGGGDERTRELIDRGRRTARRGRSRRGRVIAVGSVAGLVVLAVGAAILFRKGPSWPPSVAAVQAEIAIACQNPNVASEPGQVNFACARDTSQILWVFALMTSDDDPNYVDAKTGRKGLEPISPAQGGQIAWSLNLHHPYDPLNPVDSLAVAARAINNIIGGATVTGSSGSPSVQPGLESRPENCARYTGSPAIIARAGFPSLCASPVTSREGQGALVADVYQQWMVGAGPVAAQDVSVLFQNANNPGDPQVQAILKTLP
jgi:hypothetical protein